MPHRKRNICNKIFGPTFPSFLSTKIHELIIGCIPPNAIKLLNPFRAWSEKKWKLGGERKKKCQQFLTIIIQSKSPSPATAESENFNWRWYALEYISWLCHGTRADRHTRRCRDLLREKQVWPAVQQAALRWLLSTPPEKEKKNGGKVVTQQRVH